MDRLESWGVWVHGEVGVGGLERGRRDGVGFGGVQVRELGSVGQRS